MRSRDCGVAACECQPCRLVKGHSGFNRWVTDSRNIYCLFSGRESRQYNVSASKWFSLLIRRSAKDTQPKIHRASWRVRKLAILKIPASTGPSLVQLSVSKRKESSINFLLSSHVVKHRDSIAVLWSIREPCQHIGKRISPHSTDGLVGMATLSLQYRLCQLSVRMYQVRYDKLSETIHLIFGLVRSCFLNNLHWWSPKGIWLLDTISSVWTIVGWTNKGVLTTNFAQIPKDFPVASKFSVTM